MNKNIQKLFFSIASLWDTINMALVEKNRSTASGGIHLQHQATLDSENSTVVSWGKKKKTMRVGNKRKSNEE